MNTDFSSAQISVSVHFTGNKSREEKFEITKHTLVLDELQKALIGKYFLMPFGKIKKVNAFHDVLFLKKPLQAIADAAFADFQNLHNYSQHIARELYEVQTHPKIKGGELYVVALSDVIIDDEIVNAIGIFKSENKMSFFNVDIAETQIKIDRGISIEALDKGAIIFNTEAQDGYRVMVYDAVSSKKNEADYWVQDFLQVQPVKNDYYHTQHQLDVLKSFYNNALKTTTQPIDRLDMEEVKLNAEKYFTETETHTEEQFVEDVFTSSDMRTAYNEYKQNYQNEYDILLADEFQIEPAAVTPYKKSFFKSILKLDKNFHIYIHGNRQLIVKGYDVEKKMNFYTVYFKEEE